MIEKKKGKGKKEKEKRRKERKLEREGEENGRGRKNKEKKILLNMFPYIPQMNHRKQWDEYDTETKEGVILRLVQVVMLSKEVH